MDRNNRRFKEEKECKTKKRLNKKIHARAREMLQNGKRDSVWAHDGGRGQVGGSRKKFTRGERRAKKEMRLLRAEGQV